MAATSVTIPANLISIDEYLNTTYRPDVDYVDGYIEERNLGDTDHGKLQKRLLILLSLHEEEWGVEALPETRVQVSPTRFRVPDVCVVREGDADEPTVTATPLVCLEVLSPDDSFAAMRRRSQDYFDMSVPEVWIFNPRTRTVYACTASSVTEHTADMLRLAGTEVEVSVEEAFRPQKRKP